MFGFFTVLISYNINSFREDDVYFKCKINMLNLLWESQICWLCFVCCGAVNNIDKQ